MYADTSELLANPAVDIAVNLIIHHAHYEVTRARLNAGKHVHGEKPMASTIKQARHLIDFAETRGLRLGCSPFTWIGEAQQTARKLIRD